MTDRVETDQPSLRLLQRAFRSFDRAAGTVEEAYRALRARVERLDLELAETNEALQANLREREEMRTHLEAVLESLTTGVIVTDGAGTILRCNGAAERLLATGRDRLLGRRLEAVLEEAGLDGAAYPLTAPNGAALSLGRAVLRDGDGPVTGGLLLLHDISVLRQLEEQCQRRSRLAAMGEMVSRIAHEIRNPLGSVALFTSLLRRDLARDPERRRYAEQIGVAVEAMEGVLANLLGYTRPARPRPGRHDTAALVRDALSLAAHGLSRPPLSVSLAIAPGAERLWGDRGQLTQVLVNLVLNAAQAMPDGGTLTIAAAPAPGPEGDGGWLRLSVADTGAGIPPEVLPRIFDPFFTTREAGTGLGLAVVHTVVEGHGGRVEVDSAVGRGSTFTLFLPGGPSLAKTAGGRPTGRPIEETLCTHSR